MEGVLSRIDPDRSHRDVDVRGTGGGVCMVLEASGKERESEFVLTDRDFRFIVGLVAEKTGIVLSEAKRHMVYSRLSRRLRALGLPGFAEYCALLKSGGDGDELVNFINAITTNLTAFFRERHHFDYLANTLVPSWRASNPERRIRIWSAGCSTGEEPYSIAITLLENMPDIAQWDIKILATDLDSNVLDTARAGVYGMERVEALPKAMLKRWFLRGNNGSGERVKVKDTVRNLVTFRQLNLMQEFPFTGPFDLIFCRNVVIYFNKDTQRRLVERYAGVLRDQGWLFLGHSESLYKVTDRFRLMGGTMYRKTD